MKDNLGREGYKKHSHITLVIREGVGETAGQYPILGPDSRPSYRCQLRFALTTH